MSSDVPPPPDRPKPPSPKPPDAARPDQSQRWLDGFKDQRKTRRDDAGSAPKDAARPKGKKAAGRPPKGEKQLYFSESRAHDFDVKATARGRGFTRAQRAYTRELTELWGGPSRYDLSHRKPFVDTRAGETTRAGIEDRTANRVRGSGERKAGGVRSGHGGVDPTTVPGVRNEQPKPPPIESVRPKTLEVGTVPAAVDKMGDVEVGADGKVGVDEPKVRVESAPAAESALDAVDGARVEARTMVAESARVGAKDLLETEARTGLSEVAKVAGAKAGKFVPVVGIGVGAALVAKDLHDGEHTAAAWDAAEAIPVVGDVVGAAHAGMAIGSGLNRGLGIDALAAAHGATAEELARTAGVGRTGSLIVGATVAGLSAISVAPRDLMICKLTDLLR